MNAHYPTGQGEFHQLIIESIREETKDFKTFFFRDNHQIHYEAGQFITLIDQSGMHEIRRSYSMVSSPVLKEPLAIGVKRLDNGFFSRKLVDLAKPGDVLTTSGASGFFRIPENVQQLRRIFFFAAGSGITPILSLIKTTVHVYPGIIVYLSYSNASVDLTAYYQELKQMERRFPDRMLIQFLFSSTPDLRKARLNRDLLLEFLKTYDNTREQTMFYVCGPESYMRMIIFLLLEEGYSKEHIKREDFNPGNKKRNLRLPPDNNNYDIHIKLHGSDYVFTVQYPDTILQAAKRIKLNLPYSCETGKCGTCVAHCLSGKVWLSNNEVLTDQDLAKGLVLTCTGHPQSPDVVLQMD